MLSAWLTDIELVGQVEKKGDYFVVVHIDNEAVVTSERRYGVAPLRWQEDHRLELHPSSTIKMILFRRSVFRLRRSYEIGQYTGNVAQLLAKNTMITKLELTEDMGRISLASLNIKLSLMTDPAEDIIRRVDADLARLKSNHNMRIDASGYVDDATAIVQTGSEAVKLIGSCVEPLGKALRIFVKMMDGVADAHPIVKVTWTILSTVYKTVQAQINQDEAVLGLAESLREMVGVAAEFPDLLKVKGTTDVIEEIGRASLEVALLIDECTRHSFIVRTARFQTTDDMKSRIELCEKNCQELMEKFRVRLEIDVSKDIKTIKDDFLAEKISAWLKAPDSSQNYNDARKKHQKSTGSWFFDSEKFSEWKKSSRYLCIYGKPGCGKTVLCSSIIAHIADICEGNESSACAYFFFDGRDAQSALQRHDGLIRSLIQQFVDQCDGIPSTLVQLYGNGHQQPSTDALEDVLQGILCEFTDSYILIDSLDECAERQELVIWLNKVTSLTQGRLHLLSTSRPENEIVTKLKTTHMRIFIDDESVEGDINEFIDKKIQTDLQDWDEYNQRKIKDALAQGARGMFRWVALQLDELRGCSSAHALEEQLKSLPDGLDETYERILLRINKHRRDDAKRFLIWIAFSTRTLTLEELAEVVLVDFEAPNGPTYDLKRKYRNQEDVFLACSGLITGSEGSIKLAHFSVKEYLLSDGIATREAKYFSVGENLSHRFIAETCLAYLLQLDSPGPLENKTLAAAPLATYAAGNWMFHGESAGRVSVHEMYERIVAFMESGTPFVNWVRLWDPENPPNPQRERLTTDVAEPLYYTSLLGFTEISRRLLQHGASVNVQSGRYGCALQAAAYNGHEATTQILLEGGADVSAQGGLYGHALQAAAYNGHQATMKILLESGADVNAQGGKFGYALQAAAFNGHEETTKILLESGADVNAQGGKYGYALQAAAYNGDEATTKILLERGADVNAQGGKYGYALQVAAYNGHQATMKILLESGADVNAQGGKYGSALQAAAYWGNQVAMKILLKSGADASAPGEYGGALQAAAYGGKEMTVKTLLEGGADVNAQGGNFGNALQAAAYNGHEGTMRILLESGADVNAQGGYFGCALQAAAGMGQEATVRILLEGGADVNAQGGEYSCALQAAAGMGQEATVRILLEGGADVNAQGGEYSCALQAAAGMGQEATVRILLESGADVNAQGGEYGYALQAAAGMGQEATVRILLEGGADVNAQGGKFGYALQAAAYNGHEGTMKILLESGAHVNAQGGKYAYALQAATYTGNLAITQSLLDLGAEVNTPGGLYGSPLQAASFVGHLETIKLLLVNRADVNAQGGLCGNTLMAASIQGHDDIVELLLENNADVNALARDFTTLLQYDLDWDTVNQIFEENEADADFTGEYVHALQAASHRGNTTVVKALLAHGADVNAQGGTYGNAIRAALDGGHDEIVILLLDHGASPWSYPE